MGKEILAIPEEQLAEVILVIREGLWSIHQYKSISKETIDMLYEWCDEMEKDEK